MQLDQETLFSEYICIPVNSSDIVGILPIFNKYSQLSPDRLKNHDFTWFFRNPEFYPPPISPDFYKN